MLGMLSICNPSHRARSCHISSTLNFESKRDFFEHLSKRYWALQNNVNLKSALNVEKISEAEDQ